MRRLTIFAKGNLDVRDSLVALRRDGQTQWNGINDPIRAHFPGITVRIQHETWTRSDALLAAGDAIPPALAVRNLPLAAHPLATQFSARIFAARADAYVLTIQPDLQFDLARHRDDGHLFHAYEHWQWPAEDRRWLAEHYAPLGMLDPAASMAHLESIVTRLRAGSDAPILVYNVSAYVPGENVACHSGMEDILSTRIRTFNLALIGLSQRTGISIVDVDRLVAQHGAERLKLDIIHFTASGCQIVADEVMRLLDEHGLFAEAEAA